MENFAYFTRTHIRSDFWKRSKKAFKGRLSLDEAARTLSNKFPYLNLKGLKDISPKITLTIHLSDITDTRRLNIFNIESSMDKARSGNIMFMENRDRSSFNCHSLYPELPPSIKGAGATLFTMIILRANSYADRELKITSVNDHSIYMAAKMGTFDPKFIGCNGENRGDAILKVPRLTDPELNAVEWYWKFVLKVKRPV